MQNGSAQGQPPQSQSYVPLGVNAESWMGFEQRIQERRFQALIESIKSSIARGDAVAARAALDEARELKPTAPELDSYDLRVKAIPAAPAATAALRLTRLRAASAFALLVVGISLLTAIDYVRSIPQQTAAESVTPSALPAMDVVADAAPAVAPLTLGEPATETVEPEPLGTAGLDGGRTLTVGETAPVLVPARPVPAAATAFVDEPLTVTRDTREARDSREVPDDFVYPTAPNAARPSNNAAPIATTPQAAVPTTAAPVPAPARVSPVVTSQLPTPAPILGTSSSAPAAAPVSAVAPRALDESRVTNVLFAYARAYGQLDASAARAVWPTVNERALARAFASLDSQNLSFEECSVELHGATANASCRGRASYVGKVGSREPRTEARLWQFQLRREGEDWKIENAEARRQ